MSEGREAMRNRKFNLRLGAGILSISAAVTATVVFCFFIDTGPAVFEPTSSSQTRVNSFTNSSQSNAAMAVWPNGCSVVVWDSRRQQQGTYGVYLQRFNEHGRRVGTETPVNLYQKNMQLNPAIAVDGLGGVWVAWESFGQDGSMNAIMARRFDDRGIGGNEILVNEIVEGQQTQVGVAADKSGNATFVWTTPATADHPERVVTRTFSSDGKPQSGETAVYKSNGNQHLPTIAINDAQQIMVAWAETDSDHHPAGIHARIITTDWNTNGRSENGSRALTAFQVNEPDERTHIEPVITNTPTGFAVAWLRSTRNDYQVALRQFNHRGNPTTEMTIASPEGGNRVNGPAIVADQRHGLIVAWNRVIDGQAIVEGQQFDLVGMRVGQPFTVNQDGNPTAPKMALTAACGKSRISTDENGNLFVAWNGHCQDDKSAVGLTVLSSTPSAKKQFERRFALQSPPVSPIETDVAATAKPHDPPVFNPKHKSRRRFGDDRNPFSRGSNFGFVGIANTGWRPPDPVIAVGPSHMVAMTNGAIAFFDKTGTQTFIDEIEGADGFWGDQQAGGFVFDPEVLWDPHTNRFFAMANERDDGSFFLLAISDDDDPNGNWNKYRFDVTDIATDDDIDSPNMAIDEDTVYLTADFFGPDKFLVYMLDKMDLVDGVLEPAATNILIEGTQSYGVAMNYDAGNDATYMIRGDEFVSSDTLYLSAITDSLGTPQIVELPITVPIYGHPEDPVSMGTSIRPNLFESRFWSCVYRNGSLWAVHHQSPDSSTDVARVRWYEFDMQNWPNSGNTPQLVQHGEIHPDADTYTFFPSIWVDDGGNAAITFAKSSSTEFISMCRSLRMAGDPLGEFQPLEVVRLSDEGYTLSRWGDYSGTMDDPADPGTFWGIHEYAPAATSWNTWIGKYDLPFIEVPALATKFLDGLISFGTLSDLDGSNDQYLGLEPSPTTNLVKQRIEVILLSESPILIPSAFGLRLETKMIGGHSGDVIQEVQMFNQLDEQWETVDTRPASNADDRFLATPTGDLTRFINQANGEIVAKLIWNSESFAGAQFVWSIDVDQAMWHITE